MPGRASIYKALKPPDPRHKDAGLAKVTVVSNSFSKSDKPRNPFGDKRVTRSRDSIEYAVSGIKETQAQANGPPAPHARPVRLRFIR
jgi:hypothetical protein